MARILIGDDCPKQRALMDSILAPDGHDVVAAKDGTDAIRRTQGRGFDLVVTDILMPGRDGFEVIMASRHCSPAPRIIAISGVPDLGQPDYLRMARDLGADSVLQKPFGAREFAAAVAQLLPLPLLAAG